MTRLKAPDKPLSPNQIMVAARDARRAERVARNNARAELDYAKFTAKAALAKAKVEFKEWRAVQADRKAYLAEIKRLREHEPQTLLEREIEMLKTARARAKSLAVVAVQSRNMADLNDPDERDEVQAAQTLAEEAAREAKALAVVVCRRRKQVGKWLADVEASRTTNANCQVNA